jgi:hypothetical protein
MSLAPNQVALEVLLVALKASYCSAADLMEARAPPHFLQAAPAACQVRLVWNNLYLKESLALASAAAFLAAFSYFIKR